MTQEKIELKPKSTGKQQMYSVLSNYILELWKGG